MIDPEEIRRAIAWVLCATMPPNDTTLRTIYANHILLDSLGCDSIDRVELAVSLEEKFGIEISDAVYPAWSTIGEVIRSVQSAASRPSHCAFRLA